MDDLITLARAETPTGEIALRRRGDITELIVNGVFAMDSSEVTSEIALADASPLGRVLVGGLGLGYTAARLLERGASEVDVVELAAPLIDWARQGLTPQLDAVAHDPRVSLHAADVVDFVRDADETWDAILLDVDNGPSFLIHDHNARIYRADLLSMFLGRLSPGGRLLIWCEVPSPGLLEALRGLDAEASEILIPVERDGHAFDYALYATSGRIG